jgi:hypothetical protein
MYPYHPAERLFDSVQENATMSRNKDTKPSEATSVKAEPANAIPEQLSDHQLDKVVGGSVGEQQ